jgi:hypothetical protein
MDLALRALIAVAAIVASLQYGRRIGTWWGTYSRAEKVNRLGFGLLLLGLIEGSVEAVIVHLPTGPRNVIALVALLLISGGYAAMSHARDTLDR